MKDGNEKQYDYLERKKESATACLDPSLTVQSDAADADINTIVSRFGIGAEMPLSVNMPSYQDFEDVFDYQTAQNVLIQARDAFMSLPAKVRSRFDNDPHEFMQFVYDPANGDELIALGLREVMKDNKPTSDVPAKE